MNEQLKSIYIKHLKDVHEMFQELDKDSAPRASKECSRDANDKFVEVKIEP